MEIPALVTSTIFALSFFGLYLYERSRRSLPKSTPTPPQQDLDWAMKQAQSIITSANKKAQAVVSEAEIEGIKLAAQGTMEAHSFGDNLKQALSSQVKQSEDLFSKEMQVAQNAHLEYIKKLETDSAKLQERVDNFIKASVNELLNRFEDNLKIIQDKAITTQQETENTMKSRVNEILIQFEQNLSSFLANSQQRSTEAVSLEIKSARELIEAYKTEQLSLIDENVVSILERTLQLVMRRNMSLKEHVDLVFDSLERAKSEKFFV